MVVPHLLSCVGASIYSILYVRLSRFIGEALSQDEGSDRMKALELYNKSLSTIRSGLAILQSSVGAESGDSPALHEIRGKMER